MNAIEDIGVDAMILNSPRAIEMSVYVVRAFVQLRELLASNLELARQLKALEARVMRKLDTHDQAITEIIKTIRQLMSPPEPKKPFHRFCRVTGEEVLSSRLAT